MGTTFSRKAAGVRKQLPVLCPFLHRVLGGRTLFPSFTISPNVAPNSRSQIPSGSRGLAPPGLTNVLVRQCLPRCRQGRAVLSCPSVPCTSSRPHPGLRTDNRMESSQRSPSCTEAKSQRMLSICGSPLTVGLVVQTAQEPRRRTLDPGGLRFQSL